MKILTTKEENIHTHTHDISINNYKYTYMTPTSKWLTIIAWSSYHHTS